MSLERKPREKTADIELCDTHLSGKKATELPNQAEAQVISPGRMYLMRKTRVEEERLLEYEVAVGKIQASTIVQQNISMAVKNGIMLNISETPARQLKRK